MLDIINNLAPFIEDCYLELGVREYAKTIRVSPPTASKILKELEKEGLLKKRPERKYLLFSANRNSEILRDLSKIYWREKLKELIDYINSELYPNTILFFGSLTKLEAKKDSDIDVLVITKIKKQLDFSKYIKMYKRNIQLFNFPSFDKINEELKNNMLNGFVVRGRI